MEEYLTVDKDYLRAFNQGYTLAKETGLKSELLENLKEEKLDALKINKSRLNVIKLGMQQYEFDKKLELAKQKDKSKTQEQKRDDRSKDKGR
ncbi:hypothetical protein [uncultured Dokdonia sp.]|uniref:hypothetical protein n=1 Tax=uncultured Dokdonia sp. TaxID=575653 RepID=UPI0026094EC8|nr:hypothetical protein [uncultured Dokdonia sp.]